MPCRQYDSKKALKEGGGTKRITQSGGATEAENKESKHDGVAPYRSPTDRSVRAQNQRTAKNHEGYGEFPKVALTIPGITPYQYEQGGIGDKEPRAHDNKGRPKGK